MFNNTSQVQKTMADGCAGVGFMNFMNIPHSLSHYLMIFICWGGEEELKTGERPRRRIISEFYNTTRAT
jgi:hypothetical protein